MFRFFKPFLILMILSCLVVTGKQVEAAYSPVDFAIPIEKQRFQNAIALIRLDNSMDIINIEFQELLDATVNHNGSKIAYTVREDNRIKIFTADTDGNNAKEVCDYRSDSRNISDFISLRFIKNGQFLIMAKFVKNELAFLEYDVSRHKTRFLHKIDWRGSPFTIYSVDSAADGQLVYKLARHLGGNISQQIWTSNAYESKSGIFFEIEAPPTIVDFVPDMRNNRIFAITTNTRHMPVREVAKSLSVIDNVTKEPKTLVENELFTGVQMSNDGRFLLWRSSPVGADPQFKRYNINTGEITNIPAASDVEETQATQAGSAGV